MSGPPEWWEPEFGTFWPDNEHVSWYPEEEKQAATPHCSFCGRFVAWNDYYGRYLWHEWQDWDTGMFEPTCR